MRISKMDKRDLARLFRGRIKSVLDSEEHSVAQFLRDTGIDRSALSQFLNPGIDRLPRAEALRNIASARGISIDWLLGLENAKEGRREITQSPLIEPAGDDGTRTIDAWRAEAAGLKLRYVPAQLPDIISLPALGEVPLASPDETLLGEAQLQDTDIEIAMPLQTLQDLSAGSGLWSEVPSALRHRQLAHMAHLTQNHYPTLRLHLFDARSVFAAPFTVFGKGRVALFLGESYLVITETEQIRGFIRIFDSLVRRSLIGPDRVARTLEALAVEAL